MTRAAFNDRQHETRFRTDGFVILDLLNDHDLEHLWEAYRTCHESHDDGFTPTVLLDDMELRARVHGTVSPIFKSRILPVLSDYRIAVGSFAVKQAGSEYSNVGLHQDLTFVDEAHRGQVGISVWCPLVEVNEENGHLGVAVGTHLLNSCYREPCSLPYRDLVEIIEEEFMTFLPMRPGQVLLMDNRLFHGSPPNLSDRPRVVAAGIAVPRESQLLYCHRDLGASETQLEIWEVPEDFYLRHRIGNRPQEGRRVADVEHRVEEVTEDRLRRHFTSAPAHAT